MFRQARPRPGHGDGHARGATQARHDAAHHPPPRGDLRPRTRPRSRTRLEASPSQPHSPSTSTVGVGVCARAVSHGSSFTAPLPASSTLASFEADTNPFAGGSFPGGPRPRRSPAHPPHPPLHPTCRTRFHPSPPPPPPPPPLPSRTMAAPVCASSAVAPAWARHARCSRFARSANRWWTWRASPRTVAPRSGGWVARPAQPTSEHFSNLVAMEWAAMESAPRWVFVEDEGPHVGKCSVDPGLFQRMRHAPLVVNVVAPEEVRLRTLVQDYAGDAHRSEPGWLEAMLESVGKLHKRLGGKTRRSCRRDWRRGISKPWPRGC